MKAIFQKIWDLSWKYQNKRDDEGHVEIVVDSAVKLLKLIPANEDVVIPAAILHDIGWSKIPKEERFRIFAGDLISEENRLLRIRHQEEGVKLAKQILSKISYPEELTKHILEIISQHDTREGFLSPEEGIVRDADKMWIFSRKGFEADLRRRKESFAEWFFNQMKNKINNRKFFYSKEARKMAQDEFDKRKSEFLGH